MKNSRPVRVMIVAAAALTWFLIPARAQDNSVRAARQQFDSGNYSAAITTLRSHVARDPKDAEAYYWLCRNFYALHDYDNSISNGEQAVQLAPQNSDYHLWLGRAYGEKADREHSFLLARKGKHEFEEAVRLNPQNIPARRDLAQFYGEAPWIVGGSKDGAKQQVDAIAAMDPVQGHLARAQFYTDEKQPSQAESEVRQALNAKPTSPDALFEIAGFYATLGRPRELQSAIDAAVALRPGDPRLAYFRGAESVLTATGLPQAEQNLKSYLASTPDRGDWPSHAAAREWLGRVYEAEGKRAEAAEQYRTALQLNPQLNSARDRLKKLDQGTKP